MKKDERPIHLLVIEDNPGDVLLVEEYLAEVFEYPRTDQAATFLEAKKSLQETPRYSAILLDLSLPDLEGIQLIEKILELAGSVPVIVLTGYTNLDFSMKSLSKGISDYLLKDELSATLLYKSIVYSIERSIFSGKLKESKKSYKDLFELSPQPMWLFDLETLGFLDMNYAAIDHYGYTKEEFLSMTLKDIWPQEDASVLENVIREIKPNRSIKQYGDLRNKKKDGTIIKVELHLNNVQYEGKNASMALVHDVTEKRREEERLKLLESVVTNTTEGVMILEVNIKEGSLPESRILYVNEAFTATTGYVFDEVVGKPPDMLNGPKTDKKKLLELMQAMSNWEVCKVEMINYRKDGTEYWVSTSIAPVADGQGGYSHWVAVGRDISEQKKYEFDLRDSVKEKEVLLSEIHHRVKNNLAVVSGMMELQAFEESNQEVVQRLSDSVSRIRTMATIHELLYKSNSFSQLQFSDIIQKLVAGIDDALGGTKKIDLDVEQDPVQLNINQAIPCALIINEVITNIYKHAFVGRKTGTILVRVLENGDVVNLIIKDNGVGLPENFSKDNDGSLGLHIIKILAQQLEGEYDFVSENNGTEFKFEFIKRNLKGMASAMM